VHKVLGLRALPVCLLLLGTEAVDTNLDSGHFTLGLGSTWTGNVTIELVSGSYVIDTLEKLRKAVVVVREQSCRTAGLCLPLHINPRANTYLMSVLRPFKANDLFRFNNM